MKWLFVFPLLTPAILAQVEPIQSAPFVRPNIVLIDIDDIGVDKIAAYGEGPPGIAPPCTPNIDRLAQDGLLFRNAWTNPICSPTRAQLLTGRHGFRTGIGRHISTNTIPAIVGLGVGAEVALPEVLVGYDTSAVGKWHLGAREEVMGDGQGIQHPLRSGFDHFVGSFSNLGQPAIPCTTPGCFMDCPPPRNFTNWVKISDPTGTGILTQTCTSTYATTDTANEAIARAQAMRPPWFLYISFNAAHKPIHDPPLCHPPGTCATQYCPSMPTDPTYDRYNAMVEALDSEIGRTLAEIHAVDPRAYVFLIGDNGTSEFGAQGAAKNCFDPMRSKGTPYEGGVNVPLIVRGPGIAPGTENTRLVNSTDLFATIAQLAHVASSADDSVSLAPYLFGDTTARRRFVYAENFMPNQETPDHPGTPPFNPSTHTRAIRDSKFKLIRFTDRTGAEDEAFYDLDIDPCETNDLCPGLGPCNPGGLTPDQRLHYLALQAQLISMRTH